MKLRKRTLDYVADQTTNEPIPEGKKRKGSLLRRGAAEIMNYRIIRKFILIGVAIGTVVMMISYAFVLLYNRTGRFSVAVDNPDTTYAITLCEHADFRTKSSRLTNDQQVTISNLCGEALPKNIDQVDGEHNGDHYLAYTFYCKNIGTGKTALHYEVTFNNVTNHIDECIRVRVYVNGEKTDYAKTRSDGGGIEPHLCDASFAGKYTVCAKTIDDVALDEYVRFTVVIWVEGDDPDCNDSVVHGKIKFDMQIEARPIIE